MGMVMENMVAQMLTASGHKLYFPILIPLSQRRILSHGN